VAAGVSNHQGGHEMFIAYGAAGAVLLGMILWFVALYNRFIRGKNLVREAWSGIEVQLKRRHDLIPNLLETVKGYMQYERQLLQDITSLRSKSMSTDNIKEKASAENALSGTLKTLFALAEAYPDLKANQSFLDLQKNLADIEEQIQLARRYYNGTVRDYNILVESFPSVLVARFFGFNLADFFEVESATEREVPTVKF
jgi:LemA protein